MSQLAQSHLSRHSFRASQGYNGACIVTYGSAFAAWSNQQLPAYSDFSCNDVAAWSYNVWIYVDNCGYICALVTLLVSISLAPLKWNRRFLKHPHMEVSPERTASFHSTIFSEIVKRGRNSFFKPSVPFHQDPGAPDQGKVLDNFQNDVRSLYVSGLILQQGLHLCALKKTCPGNVCVCQADTKLRQSESFGLLRRINGPILAYLFEK